jgi:rhomboid protease GluP
MNNPNDNRSDEDVNTVYRNWENEFGQRQPQEPNQQYGGVEYAQREPVRLRIPMQTPRIVYVLIGINIVMYLATMLLASASGVGFNQALLLLGGKFGPAIDAGEYWRFLTPIFLHGGLIHLAFNSYALYALGPESERIYGSARFLAIYILAGLAGSIASYVRSPGLSIGASGAIFGLIGTLAAFFYTARSLLGVETSRERVNQLIGLAVVNIVLGFALPGIDNAAHVGGLIVGGIAGLAMAPRYRIDERVYPPVVVRADRPVMGWMLAAIILVVLVGVAVGAIMILAGQR